MRAANGNRRGGYGLGQKKKRERSSMFVALNVDQRGTIYGLRVMTCNSAPRILYGQKRCVLSLNIINISWIKKQSIFEYAFY